MKRVAVAAVGVVSSLGVGAEANLAGIREGRQGAVTLDWLAPAGLGCSTVAQVPSEVVDLPGYPDDRKVALLAAAIEEALAGYPPDGPPERRGIFLGTGLSSVTPREIEEDVSPHVRGERVDRALAMGDLSRDRVAPWRHLPERATAWGAARIGARGPVGTTFSACAAGAEAIAAGARAVARGEADWVIAGGYDAMIHPLGMASFDVLGVLSHQGCRPFDRRRDGFLLGEGAAVLVLVPEDRCPHPLAWILGAGSSLDASGITAPHPEGVGAESAMRRALRDAGLRPEQVDWVHAHGTATQVGDAVEAGAISRVFGAGVPVSSLKGAFGHTLAAAGAVESAATVLALRAGLIPGTAMCEEPDDFGINVLRATTASAPKIALSNSFGFGGQNTSVIFAAGE
ncbi:MAG: hypothetical protein JXX28_06055 [Deltaproteobacteria bacterium]|nr:hypothetical protein [Deltaproteobacteria bacterium]